MDKSIFAILLIIVIVFILYRTWYLKIKYRQLQGYSLIYSAFLSGIFVWFIIIGENKNKEVETLRKKINKGLYLFYGLFIILLISLSYLIKRTG